MKILVISGFLGAGKTTFITELARRSSVKFVVLENELGAIGVDGGLISTSNEIEVWELSQGCICCSMKTDFATSVLTIESALAPDYLLVEPTGVGMLSKIIENIQSIAYERIQLLAPLTILDATAYLETARDFPEIFQDQLKYASTIILSKTEHLLSEERTRATEFIQKYLNKDQVTEIIDHPYCEQAQTWWEQIWQRNLTNSSNVTNSQAQSNLSSANQANLNANLAQGLEINLDANLVKDLTADQKLETLAIPDIDNLGLIKLQLANVAKLSTILENLIRGHYGNIIRAKGFAVIAGNYTRFDVVGANYNISLNEELENKEIRDSRAIFIGKNLDLAKLEHDFQAEKI